MKTENIIVWQPNCLQFQIAATRLSGLLNEKETEERELETAVDAVARSLGVGRVQVAIERDANGKVAALAFSY